MPEAVQATLDLREASKAPAVTDAEIDRLVSILHAHQGWITRRALADSFGGGDKAERQIRAIAEAAAPDVVSYPGSPGYRHWDHCTVAEIDRAIETFESSAKKLLQRAHQYRKAYYRRARAATSSGTAQACLSLALSTQISNSVEVLR